MKTIKQLLTVNKPVLTEYSKISELSKNLYLTYFIPEHVICYVLVRIFN